MTRAARVAAVGSALPERVVPNAYFEQLVDTNDEWIFERTGIRERRFASEGESTSSLAAAAATNALAAAAVDPAAVDLTILATVTGDRPLPATASYVQALLGTRGAAFDVSAGCAGFVYSLSLASAMVSSGGAEVALVIGAEVLSRVLNMKDRSTCVLFGDGAGAAVVVPADEPGVVASVLDNDGSQAGLLTILDGGTSAPLTPEAIYRAEQYVQMADGRDVFKRAVVAMADACRTLLDKAAVDPDDVSLLVPHQANARIIRAVGERLRFPSDRVFLDLERVGNTSAASVPIALDHAWRQARLRPGDVVLTVAFGAGLAWGANLIRWTAEAPA